MQNTINTNDFCLKIKHVKLQKQKFTVFRIESMHVSILKTIFN